MSNYCVAKHRSTLSKVNTSIRTVKFELNCPIEDMTTIFNLLPIDSSERSRVRRQNTGSKDWLSHARHLIAFASFNSLERGYYTTRNFGNVLQLYVRSPLRKVKDYPNVPESKVRRKLYLHTKVSRSSITITGAYSVSEAQVVASITIKKINTIRAMLDASDEALMYYQPEFAEVDHPSPQEFRNINERVLARVLDLENESVYKELVYHIMLQPPLTEPELFGLLDKESHDISRERLAIAGRQCVMCNYFYKMPLISFADIRSRISARRPDDVSVTMSQSETQGAQLIVKMRREGHPKPTTFTITSPNSIMQSSLNDDIATEMYELLDELLLPEVIPDEELDV